MTYNVVRYYFSQKNELWFFGDNRTSVHFRRIVADNRPSLYFRRISATPQRGGWSPRQKRDTTYTDMRPYMVSNIYHYIIYYIRDHNGLNNIHPHTQFVIIYGLNYGVANRWSQNRSRIITLPQDICGAD